VLARDPEAALSAEAARGFGAAGDLAVPGVEIVRGDVTDRPSLDAACRGVSGVVHAAATVSAWEKDRKIFEQVNVQGLRACVEAAAAAGREASSDARKAAGAGPAPPGGHPPPAKIPFVFVSSFFALGATDGITGDETLPLRAGRRWFNEYERTKTMAEVEARELCQRGHPLVTVYPGILYGPGPRRESNLVAGLLLEAAAGRLGGLPGGGDRRWCFTYVEDAGAGVALALEKGKPGDRFVLGGENATLREFFDLVEEEGGPAVPRRNIPYAALAAAGAASELVAGLGGPRPKVTRGAASIFRHEWAYSSKRAERALGWASRPLAEGIGPTLAGLRAAGLLR
jgi:farnesol dehydrogenase